MGMHIVISILRLDDLFVQSFNSLEQDPCMVAATMMGTCNGGSGSFAFLFCLHWRALSSRLFADFTVFPLQPGESYNGPAGVDDSNLCKCSTVGYSLISACGGCQGQTWVTYDLCCYLFQLPGPMYLHLAGRNIRLTAQRLFLPPSEFLSWQRVCWV